MCAKFTPNANALAMELFDAYGRGARSFLEVGCGTGDYLKFLANRNQVQVWGIDPFVPQQTDGRVTLLPLKAEEVAKLNRHFDLIYSIHSLHHFQDIDLFFKGLEQVLSWWGRFVFVDWKKGASTGVAETYLDPDELSQKFSEFNLRILEQGIIGDNFYLVGELKRRYLAVATDEDGNKIFPKMFGQAPFFDLYAIENGQFTFLEKRKNLYQKTLQPEKTLDVYGLVSECQGLLARRIGRDGQQRLRERGVSLFFKEGDVKQALKEIAEQRKE